jgi:hypothetical protein
MIRLREIRRNQTFQCLLSRTLVKGTWGLGTIGARINDWPILFASCCNAACRRTSSYHMIVQPILVPTSIHSLTVLPLVLQCSPRMTNSVQAFVTPYPNQYTYHYIGVLVDWNGNWCLDGNLCRTHVDARSRLVRHYPRPRSCSIVTGCISLICT